MVRLFRGSSPRPIIEYLTTDNEEGVNWVKIGDVPTSGRIITSTEEKITKEGAKKSRHVYVGDLILSNSMSYGLPYIMGIEGCIHDGWFVLRDYEQNFNKDYLCNLLISDIVQKQYKKIAAGGVVQNISSDLVNSVYISIPSLDEQRKIAGLLSLIDERIATQNKIIEKLESLIKGISNRLLYADNSMSIRIEEMLIERSERTKKNNQYEILSSTVNGIFSQRDYFSKDIASDNNVGYKIVHLHDIVLSPQNLWMGNINFNDKFDIGIVSPSYKVFSIADGFDKKYVAALLKTHHALYNYMLVSEQGASTVRRNLNYEAFEQLVFKIPSLNKQQEIGHVISLLKSQLENANLLIKTYNSQKQYLLRQMFI